MPSAQIPRWWFDPKTGEYRLINGAAMTMTEMAEIWSQILDGSIKRLSAVVEMFRIGELAFDSAQILFRSEIRILYNLAAALGKGGWGSMTSTDWGTNGWLLKMQYQYFDSFLQEAGMLSWKEIQRRLRLYIDGAFSRFWESYRNLRFSKGSLEARLITKGDERVCPTCREVEDQGWMPTVLVPLPGRLHLGCRCSMEFR